jgi:hypothetical protein
MEWWPAGSAAASAGATAAPCAKKSSHALDIVFKVGDKFPRPHGKEWENFVEATQPVQFDPAESEI